MLCEPGDRMLVAHAAVLELPEPLSATAPQPVIVEPPSVKFTVPVGLVPVTVTVNVTLEPNAAGLLELTIGIVGTQERIALSTLSRPPVMVFPCRLGTTSTLLRMAFLSADVDSEGHAESISSAVPATCGVAIDVPDLYPYAVPRSVELMELPGAPR